MPRDQYARVRPGDVLGGLPARPWNDLLDLLDQNGGGPAGPGGWSGGAVEFRVVNTTGAVVDRFGLLQPNASLNDTGALDLFKGEDVLKGIAPAADQPFVVFQDSVAAGQVGRARILGVTTALVNVTDAAHIYAAPTTATNKLTSGTSGPAKIIYKPAGTGDKWCKVLLLGQSPLAASGGPTVISEPAGTHAISTASGAGDSGTLLTDSGASGKGLYWVYLRVQARGVGSKLDQMIEFTCQLKLTSGTPSGVTLYMFGNIEGAGTYVTGALGYTAGAAEFSGLVNVGGSATSLPALQLDWVMTNTAGGGGNGTVSGAIQGKGWIVRLRSDP